MCDEIITDIDGVSTNVTNTIPTNVANTISTNITNTMSTNDDGKKVRDKTDCYILSTVLLVIILLYIIVTICCHRSKQNVLAH